MRLGVWAECCEWRHVARLVVQYDVAISAGADLAQLGDAVTVVVHADVVFDI